MVHSRERKALYPSFILLIGFLSVAAFPLVSAQEDLPGKTVYDSKCASCHGDDAKGDTKAGKMMKTPDLTTEPWKQGTSIAEVVKTLQDGLGKMPKYKGKISDEDLTAAADYTLKLSKIEK